VKYAVAVRSLVIVTVVELLLLLSVPDQELNCHPEPGVASTAAT